MLARLANEHGHWQLAEKLARELISREGNDAEAWSALGFAAFSRGRHGEARAAYEAAIRLAPLYDTARRNLAAVLTEQELSEEALAQLDELAKQGKTTAMAERLRARALMQLNRFDEAEERLSRLVSAQANDAAAQDLLLRVRQLRGDADPARDFRNAARRQGADAPLRLKYADALRRLGDNGGSEAELIDLIQTMGPIPALVGSLATVFQDTGRMGDAFTLARQALAGAPADIALAETFVATAIASGAAADALPVVEHFRAQHPRDQRWITHRLDIARSLKQGEFESWWDLARVTRHFDLDAPTGFSGLEEFLAALREDIGALHGHGNHPLDQSLRQGTQTSRNLLVRPARRIAQLLGLFTEAIDRFRGEVIGALPEQTPAGAHPLVARNTSPARIVGCWSVRLRRGGFHVSHIHPEGWLSSAFYLSVPAEVDDTARRAGWLKFGEPRFPVAGLEATGFVQPVPGRLVLFPSYLWHGTNALTSDEPRMSVAFDAVPSAEVS